MRQLLDAKRVHTINSTSMGFNRRAGRIAAGVVSCAVLMAGAIWMGLSARPGKAIKFVQVSSDKPKVSAQYILALLHQRTFLYRGVFKHRKRGDHPRFQAPRPDRAMDVATVGLR
jgi:hypothetical protein